MARNASARANSYDRRRPSSRRSSGPGHAWIVQTCTCMDLESPPCLEPCRFPCDDESRRSVRERVRLAASGGRGRFKLDRWTVRRQWVVVHPPVCSSAISLMALYVERCPVVHARSDVFATHGPIPARARWAARRWFLVIPLFNIATSTLTSALHSPS